MFRQRLRLPSHHLTFVVLLPRISGRPQRPSCSRSRTRFPSDRRTLLPLGSPLTLLFVAPFFFFPTPLPLPKHLAHTSIIRGASFRGGRPSFEEILIPSLTIKFFQPSYLRRYSNLSSPYEVNLILRSFSVFISFQESLAIWLVDRSRLKLKANEKGKKLL